MRLDWPDNERLIRLAAVFVVSFSVDESCLSPQWDHICVWWQSVQWRRRWLIGQCLREWIIEKLFSSISAECWLPELGHLHCTNFANSSRFSRNLFDLDCWGFRPCKASDRSSWKVNKVVSLPILVRMGIYLAVFRSSLPRFILSRRKKATVGSNSLGKRMADHQQKAGSLSIPQMELWRTVDTFRTTCRINQYPAAFYWHYDCCYQNFSRGRFYCHVTHGRIYSCLGYVNTKNFCC